MSFVYIANIDNLKISSTLSKGKKIGELRITNSKDNLLKLIDVIQFNAMYGKLDFNYLGNSTYIYGNGKIEDITDKESSNIDFIKTVNILNRKSQFFTSLLWLIKDNSVHLETGFLISEMNGRIEYTKNSFYHSFVNAYGMNEQVTFSSEEINEVSNYYQYFDNREINKSEENINENPLGKKFKRFERAFYLLGYARSESNLALRIMLYCTVLESLFTSDNREISHKVGERFSLILGSNSEDKLKYYKLVKDAYTIRSKAVHGQTVNNKIEDLMGISKNIDDAIREIFKGIIGGKDKYEVFHMQKNDDFEKYFTELIFS